MSEEVATQIGAIATEENIAVGSDLVSQAINLILKLVGDFFALASENWWWVLAILVLMKLEDMLIEHFKLPIVEGNIRWVILFLFTMFTSFFWKPLIQGWIPT